MFLYKTVSPQDFESSHYGCTINMQSSSRSIGGCVLSKGVLDLVGNTPMIKLHNVVPDCGAEVWLKYEVGNPTGSYKHRMAMSVLANAIE